jgi:hypothetical protein
MSKLSIPKLVCNNTISIAFHKQEIRHYVRHIKHVQPLHTFLRITFWTSGTTIDQ